MVDLILVTYVVSIILVLPLFKFFFSFCIKLEPIYLLFFLSILLYFIILRWVRYEGLILRWIFLFFSLFEIQSKSLILFLFLIILFYFFYKLNYFIDNFFINNSIGVTTFHVYFLRVVLFLSEQSSTFILSFLAALKVFFIFGFNPNVFFSSEFVIHSIEYIVYYELTDPLLDYAFWNFLNYNELFFSLASVFFVELIYFFIFNLFFILFSYVIILFFLIFIKLKYKDHFLVDSCGISKEEFILYIVLSALIIIILFVFINSIGFYMIWSSELSMEYSSLLEGKYLELSENSQTEDDPIDLNEYIDMTVFILMTLVAIYLNMP